MLPMSRDFVRRVLLIGSMILPRAALTQVPGEQDAGDEIVITARFRDESLQDLPIALTALSGDALAGKNLNSLADIAQIVPTIDVRTAASNKDRALFIRGIGTISTSPGVEPSVSTVIDGVVLARAGQATLELVDIDHIEVLRGPQGTLYGANSMGGLIKYVTKDPSTDGYSGRF